jgi:putative hydrolase
MKIELDVHTHTIASGHAFSTLQEMAQAAADKGLKVLGITEHSPGVPGTCHPIYFRNLHVVPRRMYGVELLLGAEINILDGKGNLDLDEDYMKMLDIRIAGIHSLCYEYGTIEENTHGMVQVISNPFIHIISHPGDGTADLFFEPLVLAAKENGVLLEINNSSLNPYRHKEKARENNLEILRLCKRYEQPVILGSDAHISFSIADYRWLYPLLVETEFPEELILNDKPDVFKTRLKRNREEMLV